MLNRKQAPGITDPAAFELQLRKHDYFELDNGTPVYAVNAGAQDVLMIDMVFYAGNWFEEKNIVAATTNFLLKNGTSKRTAFEINEHFEFYGAYLNRNCYTDETASLSLHTLTKHLPELLPVMSELLTDAIFPEQELQIYKQNQQQRLRVNLKKCDFVANRLIDEYLYGFDHPYGRYSSAADFDAVQREDLVQFYQDYYTKGHCKIFVAGKLPADIQQQLNTAFGHLPFRKDKPAKAHQIQPADKKVQEIINDAAGVQGAIRMAAPAINRHHPDFPKLQVVNNIFGGFFGSRLMANIREDKGYTYGIYSYLQNHLHETALMISTEAGRDVCAATITEVYKEMQLLRDELVDDEELSLVKNYMMGTILGDLDGPFQIINRWKNYVLHGLNEQYFYQSIEAIKTITAEEVQALAKQYLQEDQFYALTVV
ncbi:MAG: insulinase family protein [Chitinophagales bacterium]|nr:insulinase family protein [Chitinophagales bacterium]